LATQVLVGGISTSYGCSLDSTYRNQQSPDYAKALGDSLLASTQRISGGILVFFPSYRLLNSMLEVWGQNGTLTNLEACVGSELFVEPRDSKDLEKMLIRFYAVLDKDVTESNNSKHTPHTAIMFAVCRGKVSEGINFSDHYARAVIVVGIPYPAVNDTFVKLKRVYQDEKHKEEQDVHVSGETWYKQQAFRAINQSVGRCIRHKYDFGVILLLDPRFHQQNVKDNLSRWLRSAVVNYDCISEPLPAIDNFFGRFVPKPESPPQEQPSTTEDARSSSADDEVTFVKEESAHQSESNASIGVIEWKPSESFEAFDESAHLGIPSKTVSGEQSPAKNLPRLSVQQLNLFSCVKLIAVSLSCSSYPDEPLPIEYSTMLSDLNSGLYILRQFYAGVGTSMTNKDGYSLGKVPSLAIDSAVLDASCCYVQVNDWSNIADAICDVGPSGKVPSPNSAPSLAGSTKNMFTIEEWLPEDGVVVRYLVIPRSLLQTPPDSSSKLSSPAISGPRGRRLFNDSGVIVALKLLAVASVEKCGYLNKCWLLKDALEMQQAAELCNRGVDTNRRSSKSFSGGRDVHDKLAHDYASYVTETSVSRGSCNPLFAVSTKLQFKGLGSGRDVQVKKTSCSECECESMELPECDDVPAPPPVKSTTASSVSTAYAEPTGVDRAAVGMSYTADDPQPSARTSRKTSRAPAPSTGVTSNPVVVDIANDSDSDDDDFVISAVTRAGLSVSGRGIDVNTPKRPKHGRR
jgi:hypothetical protein